MSAHTAITRKNGNDYFRMEQLSPGDSLADFSCSVEEYAEFLTEDALRSQNDHIALTWILWGLGGVILTDGQFDIIITIRGKSI